jgi:hypothetical protein
MLDRIHALIKGKSPELAVSTYTGYRVDIIKKESNTEIHRPLPVWEYSSSENHQPVKGAWDDKIISGVCVNAVVDPLRGGGRRRGGSKGARRGPKNLPKGQKKIDRGKDRTYTTGMTSIPVLKEADQGKGGV